MPSKKHTERLNLTVDTVVKRQFEAVCALKGIPMSDGVRDALSNWLKENANPELLAAIQSEAEKQSAFDNEGSKGKGSKK